MQYYGRSTWLRSAATWIAIGCIVLVVVNGVLVLRNQDEQRKLNERQAVLNEAAQIARVNQVLVQTIARVAIAEKDNALLALLERHGVKVNQTPLANAPALPAPPSSGSQP